MGALFVAKGVVLRFWSDALAWAFPAACPGCGSALGGSPTLCVECWTEVRSGLWDGPRCERCGAPTVEPRSRCGLCLPSLLDGSPLGCTRAATLHDGAVREAIHALKYSARPGLAAPLAELILSVDPPLFRWQEYQALVPIPLHRVREAERGFNQAGRIARALSKSLGVPVQGGWLRRTRATPPLAGPGGYEERALKVRGAFRARLPPDAAGCSVLLVDDVLTTGATTSEAARVLVEARAGRVDAVAVARALPANGSDGAPAR